MSGSQGVSEQWQCGKSLPDCLGYLLDNEVSSDVTFFLGEAKAEVKAHKLLLIARSPVFYAMLEGPMKEKDTIDIPDIDADTFGICLKFIYTDIVKLTAENVTSVLYVAKKYCLESLSKKCTDFLESNLSDQNACLLYEQSHIYDESELHERCYAHILHFSQNVLKYKGFRYLCSFCCDSIISSDELSAKEELVYEAMMSWSDAECQRRHLDINNENKREVLGDLFYKIRFPLIDKMYFAKNILKQDLLSDKEKLLVVEKQYDVCDLPDCKFSGQKRIKNSTYERIFRFQTMRIPSGNSPGLWVCTGSSPDWISFDITADAFLYGVVLYGDRKASSYSVELEIINDQKSVISSVNSHYTAHVSSALSDVLLPQRIRISKGKKYKVKAMINGPRSCYGQNSKEAVSFKTSIINFSNAFEESCQNGTSTCSGQIPGLLLSLA